jgi:hypothetical protein
MSGAAIPLAFTLLASSHDPLCCEASDGIGGFDVGAMNPNGE